MSKQVLEIGDTGAELVSKFNNNSDDSYNDIAAIKTSTYLITDYGCIGDAVTDNTTAFGTLLTTIGLDYATIKIPNGRFIIGTCTIPDNIELVFENGGRIIWKSNSLVVIHGLVNAGHKWIFENESEIAEDLGNISIHRNEWISPIWWGGKMDGLNGSATTNYNAFRSAWNSVPRLGDTQAGGSIKFPAGIFYMNGFANNTDGFKLSAKYGNIVGAGKTKTTIKLASGQNKSLWNTYDNFDFDFKDIGFNGNASANTEMTDALISIDYYRVNFENVYITNCTAGGMYVNEGQTNAVNYHNLTITSCGGIAITFENVINLNFSGMIDIESCLGIMDLKGTGITMYDSRYFTRATIHGSIYAEACTYGIRVYGLSGVSIKASMYARNTFYLVELIYDTTDYGAGPRNMPCTNCYVDVSQSHDSKVDSTYNGVFVDDLCINNIIVTEGTLPITGTDLSRNVITTPQNKSPYEIDRVNDYSGTNYILYTDPRRQIYKQNDTYSTYTVVPPVLRYDTVSGLIQTPITGSFTYRALADVFPADTIIYFHALVQGQSGTRGSVAIYDVDAALWYDHFRKEFSDPSAYNYGNASWCFNGKIQYISVPLIFPVANVANRLWSTISGGTIYYINFTSNPTQDLVHIVNGVIKGYGNTSILDSTELPPATAMPIGTRNFCMDLGLEVISDGTNWKKPDGTTLGA